jgi:hypothetical protein
MNSVDASHNKLNQDPMLKTPIVPFWGDNPNILFQKDHMFEFFPVDDMSYEEKLNAVSRTVIFLTVISFIFTRNTRILGVGAITLGAIYLLYSYQKTENKKKAGRNMEGYTNPAKVYLHDNKLELPSSEVFHVPTPQNAFSNVLLTDYEYNPYRKPAPPIGSEKVEEDILTQAKKMVANENPGQPDIVDKLFTDLGEQLNFEQSMRPFYSNPATTIPNDQGAFAEFCYGGMISCKEGNMFACAKNLSRHENV